VAAKLTKYTIEENKDLGKMDWEKVSKVVRCTVNADLEGNSINLGVNIDIFVSDLYYGPK